MCLYSKTNTTRVLEEDLICYKVVLLYKGSSQFNARLISPYRRTPISKINNTILEKQQVPPLYCTGAMFSNEFPYEVDCQGFHLWLDEKSAIRAKISLMDIYSKRFGYKYLINFLTVIKCVIRKGTPVYDGVSCIGFTDQEERTCHVDLVPSIAATKYEVVNYEELLSGMQMALPLQ